MWCTALLGVFLSFLVFLALVLSSISVGYVAKLSCSGLFVGHRSLESLWSDELHTLQGLPWLLLSSLEVHEGSTEDGSAAVQHTVARSWFGLFEKRALFVPGLGCHLEHPAAEPAVRQELARFGASFDSAALDKERAHASASRAWPLGDQDAEGQLSGQARQTALHQLVEGLFRVGWARSRTHALLVIKGGKIVAERYATEKLNVTRDTRLAGWSMTKSVLGALAGARVHQHDQFAEMDGRFKLSHRRFSLHRPLSKAMRVEPDADPESGDKYSRRHKPVRWASVVPEWANATDGRQLITVKHLLQMNDGLQWDESYTPVTDVTKMLFLQPDCGRFAADKPADAAPGARWQYSSGASNLLSRALRYSFDRDWDYWSYPRRALFQPLGMHSAVVEPDASGTFVGSSFMHATARDWARFGLFWLRRGRAPGAGTDSLLWPASWYDESLVPAPHSDGVYGSGHLWLRHPKPDSLSATQESKYGWHRALPVDCFYAHGYRDQIVLVCPSRDLVVVRLGQGQNGEFKEEPFFTELFKLV